MDQFINHNIIYQNFTWEHLGPILIFIFVSYGIIHLSRLYFTPCQKEKTRIVLAFIPLIALIIRMALDASLRPLTLEDDLPLHLCRILSFASPVIILLKNEKWMKILYFMILAGTLNAMITADITYGFPHYGYFIYWIYHGTLVILAVYGIAVFNLRLSIKDALHTFLIVNVYFFMVHLMNISLQANYMYTRHKASIPTILDHLGEWPFYLIWLELLALIMLLLVYLGVQLLVKKNDVINL